MVPSISGYSSRNLTKGKLSLTHTLCRCLALLPLLMFNSVMVYAQSSLSGTPARRPPAVTSNEATREQLAYARAEGDSVSKCVAWILRQAGENGRQVQAGEYQVTVAFTRPEGWYEFSNNELKWREPDAGTNSHLWLFVQDGADGRLVPPVQVSARMISASGSVVVDKNIPFAWTPLINGYGDNINIPGDGQYKLELELGPLPFHRHDPNNGDRFYSPTKVVVPLTIGMTQMSARPLSEFMEAEVPLAEGAGSAYSNTLKVMFKQANDGKDTVQSDYRVAVAVEYSEGYWYYQRGKFRYKVENDLSALTNAHVEVAIRDRQSGRFLHNMNVSASLEKKGESLGSKEEGFMWHPWLYHYGENWRIPSGGKYEVHVHTDPPGYKRYGKIQGKLFTQPVDLVFHDVKIKAGQK